jgi:hypothetical protein
MGLMSRAMWHVNRSPAVKSGVSAWPDGAGTRQSIVYGDFLCLSAHVSRREDPAVFRDAEYVEVAEIDHGHLIARRIASGNCREGCL